MVVLCWQRKRINMYRASDTLYVLFSTILKTRLWERYYFSHFSNKETDPEMLTSCSRSQSKQAVNLNPISSGLQTFGPFNYIGIK